MLKVFMLVTVSNESVKISQRTKQFLMKFVSNYLIKTKLL